MYESELSEVTEALQELRGRRVTGAWQPTRDRIVLGIGDTPLLLVPRGDLARIHTLPRRPPNPGTPFSFQGALRAHLHGTLTELRKVPGDRVVELTFTEGVLHLRLTGRSGGLWLLDGERVVAAYDGPAPAHLPELPPGTPRPRPPRFVPLVGETWDHAAQRWFTNEEAHRRTARERAVITRALTRQLARDQRLLEGLIGDLERADRAPEMRRVADVLAANLHRVPRGARHVRLPDPMTEQLVDVELDPTRSAADAMNALYRKAGRLERAGERVLEHIEEVEARVARLESALDTVEVADIDTIEELRTLTPTQTRRSRTAQRAPWATWVGPGDQRVLVGRNASGNRRLTFQVARGHDVWMHVRGRPAAHLLIPLARGKTASLELLLKAAQIALVHAGVGTGESADVQYTAARNVRSIPGSPDGLVRVHDERVLHVRRDPAALVGWSRT